MTLEQAALIAQSVGVVVVGATLIVLDREGQATRLYDFVLAQSERDGDGKS